MSGGALDASVTLEEVFAVVSNKRVPLAPELAGYLALEIAEHADPQGGDVDPKSVFVGDEGTVALVKPKREAAAGDAEASIRSTLARLLEASGSQTPALSAASKRKSSASLPALAEELEAALIPVNRAAGRRALARLAREVKRVTLGVGRNALPSVSDAGPSSRRPSAVSQPAPLAPIASEPPPSAPPPSAPLSVGGASPTFSHEEEPTTARAQIPDEVLRKATPGPLELGELPTMQFEPAERGPSPSQADVDDLISHFAVSGVSGQSEQQHARDLKAMVGLEPTPPPPELSRRLDTREIAVQGRNSDVESLLAMGADSAPPGRPEPTSAPPPSVAPAPPSPLSPSRKARSPRAPLPPFRDAAGSSSGIRDERQLPTQPSSLKRRGTSPSHPQVTRKRGSVIAVAVAAVAVFAGVYAAMQLLPGAMSGRTGATPAATVSVAPATVATACKATLVVGDVPAHAEVLLRSGQAPVDVPDMPVGTRLEFVATAEGYAPKRVVVPAGATWDRGADGKPRYEAGVQLDKSRARAGGNDPWPAGEPGSEVGGQGPPGTVHVVATPRGAEIWMLVGMGPDARIEQLHCGQDFDVLVAGPTTFRKRMRVAGSDFAEETTPGAPPAKVPTRVARVSAK
jgi:hypothetical protein